MYNMKAQLFDAARSDNVEFLNQNIVPLPEVEKEEWTALHIACLLNHVEFSGLLLTRYPWFLKLLNPDGCNALHLASSLGHLEMVELLLKFGRLQSFIIELCMKKDKDGRTPLHLAVFNGSVEIVRQLLDACPESALQVTVNGETVFHLAVKNKVKVADELFSSLLGGRPYARAMLRLADRDGNTVLHLASLRKQQQIIKVLTRQGMLDVNAVNSTGFTAFDLLAVSPHNSNDMEIQLTFLVAGGIRLSDSVEEREELKIITSGLFVMASLCAGFSVQIVVNIYMQALRVWPLWTV